MPEPQKRGPRRNNPRVLEEEMEIRQRLAVMCRVLRTKEGLTQADLANKLGINRQDVNQLERGKRDTTIQMLLALSRFFRIPPQVLCDGNLKDLAP